VTAGGLVFFATGSDRRFRAYDRDTGKEVWSMELPAASEGMPATYEIGGRQFIALPVAAGTGQFAARFGGPGPARGAGPGAGAPQAGAAPGRGAAPQAGAPPEAAAAGRQGGGRGGGRGGGGGGPQGQYMVLALKK
jgi:outer membrane protein assembly factor BamB